MVHRKTAYPIERLILERWSPRAMSGEAILHDEFMRLIEAARWAPSSYNSQPWRFIYAHRDTPAWEKLFNLLVVPNQEWAKDGAVLVLMLSLKNFEYNGKPSRTHSFCAGCAWENFALEGSALGLVVHGMEGFDYDKARKDLKIPDDVEVEAMCVVGKPGEKERLKPQLREQEFPSDRKPAKELIFEGEWGK